MSLIRWMLILSAMLSLLACSQAGSISGISEEDIDDPTPPTWNQPGMRYLLGYMNKANSSASIFSTNATNGYIAPLANSPLATGSGTPDEKPSVSPNSKCWFFHTANSGFYGYRYDSTANVFTPLSLNPFQSNGNRVLTAIDPVNRYLFSIENSTLQAYSLDSSCNPTAIPGGSSTLAGAHRIAVDSNGQYVFVLTTSGFVHRYTIQFDGTLAAGPSVNTVVTTGTSYDMIEHGGKFLFITSKDHNEVGTVKFDSSGSFSVTGKQSTGTSPRSPVVSADGTFLYLVNSGSNNLSVFSINSSSGALNSVSGSPFSVGGGSSPISVSYMPGSDLLFIATVAASDNLSVYQVNAITGVPNATPLIQHTMASETGGLVTHKITY